MRETEIKGTTRQLGCIWRGCWKYNVCVCVLYVVTVVLQLTCVYWHVCQMLACVTVLTIVDHACTLLCVCKHQLMCT